MASLPALQAKRGELIEQISNVTAARDSAQRALSRAESDLQFTRDPQVRRNREQQIQQSRAAVAQANSQISSLSSELSSVNAQIATVQQQQGAQQSTGQTVKQSQTARDDGASATDPPPSAQVNENGRIVTAKEKSPTNAQGRDTSTADGGTNAAVRRQSQTQTTPPVTASPGPVAPSPRGPYPSQTAGAAATPEDGGGGSGVRARLNNLFGGLNNRIVPQANVLDQYASYTYNISLYLMSPADYKKLLKSKKRSIAGFQLLMSSGGAPVAGGSLTPVDPQEAQQAADGNSAAIAQPNLGRNQFFPLDYYIDDVQVKSVVSGKGTGGAHNVTELKFKIIEPNGITFLDNLFAATQQYIKVSGGNVKTNYAAQNFLMVIRFYGYDDQGNLVQAKRSGQDSSGTDINSIVEKFIPFQFTGIKFRIANKLVEYECSAVCPQVNVNTGPARGVIPYNVELTSQTLKSLLTGKVGFQAAQTSEGRQGAAQSSSSRAPSVRGGDNSGYLGTNDPSSPFQVGA